MAEMVDYKIMLESILDEFKGLNTEFLYNMLENMNITGLSNDARVIQAMRNIRIEDFITYDMIDTFIPPEFKLKHKINEDLIRSILLQLFALFYGNHPLLFYNNKLYGRSTGAPHMIVIMCQLLDIEENDKVLILGSKSGYMESIIQDMDANITLYILEKVPEIYEITKFNLERINAEEKVQILLSDPILSLNRLPIKEFDKILITGYLEELPKKLLKIVKIGGVICGPIGTKNQQTLIRFFKTGKFTYDEEDCGKVIFSQLITDYNGKH